MFFLPLAAIDLEWSVMLTQIYFFLQKHLISY